MKIRPVSLLVLAAFGPTAAPLSRSGQAALQTGTVYVTVMGVKSAKGRVHVELCRESEFLKDCPTFAVAPARAGQTLVAVPNVPPGRWAAQGYHDANANERVDTGLFGIPKEGVGFSNDAPIGLGPPRFARAAFDVEPGAPKAIAFKLRYF